MDEGSACLVDDAACSLLTSFCAEWLAAEHRALEADDVRLFRAPLAPTTPVPGPAMSLPAALPRLRLSVVAVLIVKGYLDPVLPSGAGPPPHRNDHMPVPWSGATADRSYGTYRKTSPVGSPLAGEMAAVAHAEVVPGIGMGPLTFPYDSPATAGSRDLMKWPVA
jgi:hypothetical protein